MSSPFRPDDFAEVQGRQVLMIGARLRVGREMLKGLELMSEVLTDSEQRCVVRVTAKFDGGAAQGLGVSVVAKEKVHMQRWALALAETRGRHRALSASGIGAEHYGFEEMVDSDEPTWRDVSMPTVPGLSSSGEKANGEAVAYAQQRAAEATEHRKYVTAKLREWSKGDDARAREMLEKMIGQDSVAKLNSDDAFVAYVATKIVEKNRGLPAAKIWLTKVFEGMYKSWEELRGKGPTSLQALLNELNKPEDKDECPF